MGLLHALLSAAMLVAALVVPFKLLKLPLPGKVIIVAVALAITAIISLGLSLRFQGYRVLRFITLVPIVIAFALLLRGTAPIVNFLQSARPVEEAIHQGVIGQIPPIAVYDVPPGVRYGLGFYLNQPIRSYEQNEVPSLIIWLWPPVASRKNWNFGLPDGVSRESALLRRSTWIFM